MSGRERIKALTGAALPLVPVVVVIWAFGLFFMGFGLGQSCTSEPACTSGTTSCSECRPALVALWAWSIGQLGLLLGLVVWVASRPGPRSKAVSTALTVEAAGSGAAVLAIFVAVRVAT